MTNLHRHRRARTRDALHRRVRTLTAVVGLGSLTGAGALTIELAEPTAAAVQPTTPARPAPATTPASSPAQAPAATATPHVARVHHARKPVRHPAPAPAPVQSTASSSTSGGS